MVEIEKKKFKIDTLNWHLIKFRNIFSKLKKNQEL